ncbi:hypothetical protein AB0D12_30080 [Streptomyces sp. NPDC048479]|uniref:hypothetical protein n=1 Tax=Streptomyces sp. NPDC048479 TaxID=3154725 RepID=UPI003425F352
MGLQSSSPRRQANGEARVPAPAGESDPVGEGAAEASSSASSSSAAASSSEEHTAADADGHAEGRSRGAEADRAASAGGAKGRLPQDAAASGAAAVSPTGQTRRRQRANRRPSGRERHDEKITVYVSAEELMDLEHARLVLRGEHGLAVDRGRIVREAVAVVLADLEQRGDASILVRRLRGR